MSPSASVILSSPFTKFIARICRTFRSDESTRRGGEKRSRGRVSIIYPLRAPSRQLFPPCLGPRQHRFCSFPLPRQPLLLINRRDSGELCRVGHTYAGSRRRFGQVTMFPRAAVPPPSGPFARGDPLPTGPRVAFAPLPSETRPADGTQSVRDTKSRLAQLQSCNECEFYRTSNDAYVDV